MLDLKDFFHLPEIDDMFAQIANHRRGVIIVAGLHARPLLPDAPVVPSGRSTITAILMRRMLDSSIEGRASRAAVVGPDRSALRVARQQRKQVEFVSAPIDNDEAFARGLRQVLKRKPDLLVIDRLNAATAPAIFEAAGDGCCVLTQIDTSLAGGEVFQEMADLGCSLDQISRVSWVITVHRVPALCAVCRRLHRPGEALLETMSARHGIERAAVYYAAHGCEACEGSGYHGEVTVFDVFRAPETATRLSEWVSTPSLLSIEGYMARLAEQGYLALEDAVRFGASTLRQMQQLLVTREHSLDETTRMLQRKLAEIEAANKVLTQRTGALIALQDVSQTLSASTRLDEVAQRVVHYACQLCGGDRAVLYLIEPSDEGRVLAVDGWDASVVGKIAQLPDALLAPGEPGPMSGMPPAIELASERAHLRASLRVPLVAEESLVGLLIVSSLSKTRFAPGSVALLKTFGSQAAVSIQRVRLIETLHDTIEQLKAAQSALIEKERIERELELARELQLGSLPGEFPEARGVRFASAYRPAREVGGDLYDVIELSEERLGLFIADVSDKGLPAAFYMGLTRSLFLAEARRSDSPREVLSSINRLLGEISRAGMFVTAFYGVYDARTGRLRYSRAGHDQPLWLRPDGSVTLLDARGMLLGSLAPGEFELTEAEAELSPGDMLILYTDGLTDALNPYGIEYGARHWINRARECAGLPADRVCSTLFNEVAAFQLGAPQFDDMALLVMQIIDF